MSRTITALFDSRSDAEAARSRLTAANIDADNVSISDQSSMSASSSTGSSASGDDRGVWGSIKDMFLPEEDRQTYEEGMRRGGYMLCANVDDDQTDEAVRLLEETSSVDLEERERSWRSEGWAGYTPSTATTGTMGTTDRFAGNDEERIQLGEETLKVGKREVNRGGARIRTYVVEEPVSEQVTLHEEHVNIERRPVDGTMQAGELDRGALFQEREIDVTETAEEAVVSKEARVTEELVVSKTSEDRVETIEDTVRRTEVDIDKDVSERSAFASDTGNSNDRDRF